MCVCGCGCVCVCVCVCVSVRETEEGWGEMKRERARESMYITYIKSSTFWRDTSLSTTHKYNGWIRWDCLVDSYMVLAGASLCSERDNIMIQVTHVSVSFKIWKAYSS